MYETCALRKQSTVRLTVGLSPTIILRRENEELREFTSEYYIPGILRGVSNHTIEYSPNFPGPQLATRRAFNGDVVDDGAWWGARSKRGGRHSPGLGLGSTFGALRRGIPRGGVPHACYAKEGLTEGTPPPNNEKKEEGSEEKAKGNKKKMLGRKRARKEQQQESSKKQRIEEDKETYEVEEVEEDDEAELKKHLVIKQ
ncbi:hypothetical protein Tco_0658767, partial [Tanacetum coccineum]